jgi:outer membrane usher protein FimD/PapC
MLPVKSNYFLATVCLTLSATTASFAQNSILAGKITDENNLPVASASIVLQMGKEVVISQTNKNGLYTTSRLPPGNYKVSVITNGVTANGGEVTVPSSTGKKLFHNYTIKNHSAIATITREDPFLADRLAAIAADDDPRDMFIFDGKRTGIIFVKKEITNKQK